MIRFLLSALAGVLLAAAPAAAQDDYPPLPKPGAPKPYQVPASETYTLPNGMQVTLIPFGQVPKATINLRVYAGSLNEGEKNGLASLTAQMLREGAAGRKGSDLAEEAAAMGGSILLGGSVHEMTLGIAVLAERAPDAINLLGDVAIHPDFPASEIERIRQNYLRGLAVAKSQPQVAANVALNNAYYGPDNPFGRGMPTDEQVKSYTLEDVKAFHRANFGAKRARIYVAGQFDPAAVKAAIERVFGGWAAGPERLRLTPAPKAGPQVILVDRPGASQSTLRLAWPAPVAGSSNDIPFEVMDSLLGGSFTSRITKNIREDKGYTYSPNSYVNYNPGEGLWGFNADVTTDVTGAALKEVFGEIRKLQTVPIPDSEGTGIRTWMSGTYILQNASQTGLIGSLAQVDLLGLPKDYITTYVPRVMAVTNPQMQQAARQLPLDKMTLIVVGDLAKVEPQLKALPELQGMQFQRVTPF
ncbi:MAG TPA: pitrilysin family protein [Sphingomicrobium sp.]|nr:pitrilysin family protein [Sphingomicrobium sp.]